MRAARRQGCRRLRPPRGHCPRLPPTALCDAAGGQGAASALALTQTKRQRETAVAAAHTVAPRRGVVTACTPLPACTRARSRCTLGRVSARPHMHSPPLARQFEGYSAATISARHRPPQPYHTYPPSATCIPHWHCVRGWGWPGCGWCSPLGSRSTLKMRSMFSLSSSCM